jgi:hypothetical protein
MLTGLGDEEWMTKTFQDKRNKIREDRTKYTSDDISRYDCDSIDIGGGDTDNDNFEIKQYPYPINTTVRPKKRLDVRDYDNRIGD